MRPMEDRIRYALESPPPRLAMVPSSQYPAAVKTEIFEQMTREHINYMLSKIPMGRFGTTDEVSSLVCWLASSECSFSTGSVFDISGGRATY